jgi:hypothetical protein
LKQKHGYSTVIIRFHTALKSHIFLPKTVLPGQKLVTNGGFGVSGAKIQKLSQPSWFYIPSYFTHDFGENHFEISNFTNYAIVYIHYNIISHTYIVIFNPWADGSMEGNKLQK